MTPRHLSCARARRQAVQILGIVLVLILSLVARSASAQIGSQRYASLVIEAASGRVLSSVNPDEPRYPASLTKMMTLYMVFEAMRDRRIGRETPVPVSAHAASQSPTKLGLVPGSRITVEQAVLGLVTKSANDAACALGELLGGDEARFAQIMTLRARALGMARTTFRNASGLPDGDQVTTARDLAVLARHLVQDFPDEYRYFSVPSFTFRGRVIPNHDRMLQSYPGADGIKTGYIDASGFNLVTSAVRGDVRLIGVVLGAARPGERDIHMAELLDRGFEQLDVPVAPKRDAIARNTLGLIGAAQAATVRPARVTAVPDVWVAQSAILPTLKQAKQLADVAGRAADGDAKVERVKVRGRISFRVVFPGLTFGEARAVCAALSQRKVACTPVRAEAGQVASR